LFCIVGLLIFDFNFDTFQPFLYFDCTLLGFWSFALDGLSLLFVLLVAFIFPLCLFSINFYSYLNNRWSFVFLLVLLEVFLFFIFSAADVLVFYIFFEATLLPMFLLIGRFGSRFRKIKAAYYLFFYTFIGSIFMLLGLFSIYSILGSFSFYVVFNFHYALFYQKILCVLFFITFAVKTPMVPFHIWLPEAHVEAPTVGSILLASVLLKLGSYGFIRFLVHLFPFGCIYFSPIIFLVSICGILFASFSTLRQVDVKRIIAYSSIAHMNMAVLGLFLNNIYGFFGSIYLMMGHGLISAGLFFAIGVLYDRYHTRLLFYYGGLTVVMPMYSFFLLFLSFANIGFPGTFNFISELNVFIAVLFYSFILLFFLFLGFVLTVVYSI